MIVKMLKVVLLAIAVVLGIAVVLALYGKHIMGFYFLLGAVGVGFFVVAMQALSVIQKGGQQDD